MPKVCASPGRLALRSALAYFALAAVWVVLSGRLLVRFVPGPDDFGLWSTANALLFVAATSVLFYRFARRHGARLKREWDRLDLAEAALGESHERFRALSDHASDGIFLHDEDGRFLDVNPQACLSLGYSRDELLERSVFHIEECLDREHAAEFWTQIPPGGVRTLTGSQRRKDGTSLPVEVRVSCCLIGGKRRFIGVARDVARRRQAETALQESESRFRELVETVREVFWIADPKMERTYYVSPRYEQVWGRTCASRHAAPRSWLEAVVPSDRDRISRAADRVVRSGDYDVTYRIERPDGGLRWIHDRGYPVRNAAGRIERIAGVAEDITDRKMLEEQILRAQRLEAIGSLASGVAHDLNNILAPMLMAASVVKQDLKDPRSRQLLEMIEQGAQRGAGVVRQLLTFSRGVEGERAPVQLRHLIKEMANIIRETFPRQITLATRAPADLALILADATQIHQVLMNLCVNARDAMPAGGTLSIAAEDAEVPSDGDPGWRELAPGPYVALRVSDTGTGISPEIISRIFDPFFTTKAPGKGTGIGLSTAMSIVKSHRGAIRVDSEPGRGTSVRIYLPSAPPAETEAAPAGPKAISIGERQLVLVVDDEPSLLETLGQILRRQGYRVLTAGNGREALALLELHRRQVKLVIADVMMPVMDGLALAERLRIDAPEIPVIGISGLALGERQAEVDAAGSGEILLQPFRNEALLEAVGRNLAAASIPGCGMAAS